MQHWLLVLSAEKTTDLMNLLSLFSHFLGNMSSISKVINKAKSLKRLVSAYRV